MAKPIEIQVEISPETGDITCSRPVVHAKRSDEVRWTSNGGPFTIQFKGMSPFDSLGKKSHKPTPTDKHVVEGKVHEQAPAGRYHYAIAMFADGGVALDAGSPEIIIDF